MTLYVKGFKIDRQKVANVVGARDSVDHLVDAAIRVIMGQLNRSAYLNLVGGYEPPSPDGERHLALIIALEIGEDKDELEKKDLGEIDESIREALPHVLVGPAVWELWDHWYEFGSSLDGWDNVNVVKYRPDQVNSAQCFPVEQAIPYHDDLLIPTLKLSVVPNFWLLQ
jgi:hypothetical protein